MAPILDKQLSKMEVAVDELLALLLTVEGEEPIDINLPDTHNSLPPSSKYSRRGSVPMVELNVPPGEKAEQRRRQKINEIREEANDIREHFKRKALDSLIKTTKNTLEKLCCLLVSSSMLSYGQAINTDVKPILKLELALSLPSIVVRPSLDEVQGIINDVVHAILGVFRGVYQWGQDRGILKATPESTVLLSPSKISALAGALGSPSKLLQSPSTLGILGSPSIINTLGSPSKINALGSPSKINALGSPSKIL